MSDPRPQEQETGYLETQEQASARLKKTGS
jgi:hypothetical protein